MGSHFLPLNMCRSISSLQSIFLLSLVFCLYVSFCNTNVSASKLTPSGAVSSELESPQTNAIRSNVPKKRKKIRRKNPISNETKHFSSGISDEAKLFEQML